MLTSLVRTLVPLIVGWLISLPILAGADISSKDLTTAVTVLVVAVYYVAVRLLERVFPGVGWLLGSTKQPVYRSGYDKAA